MRRREFIAGIGGAMSWTLAARAQQRSVPVIGYLDYFGPALNSPGVEALRAGLADGGFVEGANLFIEDRWAGGTSSRLADLAADLVRRQVALIVAVGAAGPILAAKAATSTIPIVFFGGDPVNLGLVSSLNRPVGNITGIITLSGELAGKRLDLLLKLVPQGKKIGFLSGTKSFFAYEEQTTAIAYGGARFGG
jgi:putative ABC transport system substrate-binding protein